MAPLSLKDLGRSLARGVLELALPSHCALCGIATATEEGPLCPACWTSIEAPPPGTCVRCGTSILLGTALCRACDEPVRAFEAAFFLLPYRGKAREVVHLFKYGNKPGLATMVGHRLGDGIVATFAHAQRPVAGAFDRVVPVPLTRRRLAERGYNQAERIALGVAERTGWRLDRRALVCVRWRASQTTLDAAGRLANVTGAFRVAQPEGVRGTHVLLVDDVVTTGATANVCRDALLGAGTQSVTMVAAAYAGSVDMDVPEPLAVAELERDL